MSLSISNEFSKRNTGSSVSTYRWNLAILVSSVALGLVYLFTINTLGTKGYEIRKLEQEVKLLSEQQKTMQMEASDMQSINRISDEAQKLNFVPASNVSYLKAADFALK